MKEHFNILQGTMEIGNQMNTISRALRNIANYNSITMNYYPYYLQYKSDYTYNLLKLKNQASVDTLQQTITSEMVPQFNMFHFHFGTTLKMDYSDLAAIKADGKYMVMHHWGSEVRRLSIAQRYNPYAKTKVKNEQSIQKRLSSLSPWISHCIIPDYELYPYVVDAYEYVHVVPSMVDPDEFTPIEVKRNSKPLFVHAPTSREIKGTAHILRAIENLKHIHDFDFKLIEGMSHETAKSWYRKADLVIDQLHIGSYGILAIESMALGKPVVCWISDYMKEHYPDSLPILSANPDTIEQTLEFVLRNLDILPEIGQRSRQYVEQHHNMYTNINEIVAIYKSIADKEV